MNRLIASPYTKAFLAGAVAVLGFAPFGIFLLPVFALAVLFWIWSQTERPSEAAWVGFSFGMGLFCVGVSWIYVALHIYGYMHPILAAIATILFAAVNAALPALVGYVQMRFKVDKNVRILILMPAIWTLGEWLHGLLFTGFPWLSMGYSQVAMSPLAGFAPLLGVFGVSLVVAVSAAILLVAWNTRRSRPSMIALGLLLALWISGAVLRIVEWTDPHGEPLKVSLLQGNIGQETKFADEMLIGTLETYRRLVQSSDGRLIVMPETALPLLRSNLPETYQSILREYARHNDSDILIGAFEKENGKYYNSVYSIGSSESQHYRKNHLVPFGEFIPFRSVFGWIINDLLDIPMGDLASGGANQSPISVAGQKIAVNICYEDAFGEEIIHALPNATLLVNVTNDAWYGDSDAAMQHNQLSQMRALETGRMVLRATNTGITSVIGIDGRIQAMLPQHTVGILTAQVQGYVGSTPYVRWGNMGILGLVAIMLGLTWKLRGRVTVFLG